MTRARWLRNHPKAAVLAVAGSLMLLSWVAQTAGAHAWWGKATMLLATVLLLPGIAREAWGRLQAGQASISLLVTLAAVGAITIGEVWEAAAVTFLYVLGGVLEGITLARTRDALRSLVDMAPHMARIKRDNELVSVPIEEVSPGMTVVVLPGDRVPVDGIVQSGQAVLDASALTGESLPVEAQPGTSVLSGSVSQAGYLEVQAERVGFDTTFQRMLYLVAEAQEQKPTVQQFLDRFARWYTLAVVGAAVLIAVIVRDYHLALTFLVIACPGALVMAAPVAVVAGIGRAARQGVLIKGGERLERLARINVMAFDKTGTLTLGQPEVVTVGSFIGEASRVLALAAGAEQRSEHHLASAILNTARKHGVVPVSMDAWELQPGMGVQARREGVTVLVGNRRLLADHDVVLTSSQDSLARACEARGETVAFVVEADEVVGLLGIADQVRPEAAQAVAHLQQAGVRTLMLTGDHEAAASAVARLVGIDEVRSGLLPEDKVAAVQALQAQGYVVAMVGDGVNDAPALVVADASIAMGASGTKIAMETADMALMGDSLHRLPDAIALSRQILAVVKQNVVFSVVVVLALLAGVLGQVVYLGSGMLIHELSVLLVIINGMRLLRPTHTSYGGKVEPTGSLTSDVVNLL